MSFDQAVKIARQVVATEGMQLVAIGRFVPVDQLPLCDEWHVSVAGMHFSGYAKISSEEDWQKMRVKADAGRSAKREREQPRLF